MFISFWIIKFIIFYYFIHIFILIIFIIVFIIPLTNYIIVPFSFEIIQELDVFNNKIKPIFTTPNFIIDSIYFREIQDIKVYKPFKPFLSDDLSINLIKNRKQNYIISDLFKGETFSIVTKTYSTEEYNIIKEKIIENHGELIDIVYDESKIKVLRAKIIILNDGVINKTISDTNLLSVFNLIHHIIYYLVLTEKSLISPVSGLTSHLAGPPFFL